MEEYRGPAHEAAILRTLFKLPQINICSIHDFADELYKMFAIDGERSYEELNQVLHAHDNSLGIIQNHKLASNPDFISFVEEFLLC